MRYEEIKIGQQVFDPTIKAFYVWCAGSYVVNGEPIDLLCSACGFPDKYFLRWKDEKETVTFCTECADIENLQPILVAVK